MLRWILRLDEAALAGLPELGLFSDEQQRKDALKEMEQLTVRSLVHISAFAFLFLILLPILSKRLPQLESPIGFIAFMLTVCVLVRYASVYLTRRSAARFLRRRLLECNVPVCLDCGYCLRGLTSDSCPECGKELDERVQTLIRAESQPEGGAAS